MRVLGLDDNRDWYETVAPIKRAGDEFVMARTVEYGLYLLQYGGPWDRLYLDFGMGEEKNGGDVIAWLAANREFLPGCIFTTSTNPKGRADLMTAIVALYGVKGVSPSWTPARTDAGRWNGVIDAGRHFAAHTAQADATGDSAWAYADAEPTAKS